LSNTVILKIYSACEWISGVALLTLTWLLFTLMGLGVFGFMPATSALFSVSRNMILGDRDSGFKTFYAFYKEAFIPMNVIGILLGFVLAAVGINFSILTYHINEIPMAMAIPFFMGLLLLLFFLAHLFPAYSHFKLRSKKVFQHVLALAIVHPLRSLAILAWSGSILLVSLLIPFLLPFFTMGLIAWGTNFIALKGYGQNKSAAD